MTLYAITLSGHYGSLTDNPFVNVFTYDMNDLLPSTENADYLAQEFHDQVVDHGAGLVSILSTGMTLDSIVVKAPQNPDVLSVFTMSLPGQRVGSPMPAFVAWGFKQRRLRGDMRAGFKRFGYISETDTSGDVPTAGMTTVLNAFALRLRAPLTITSTGGTFSAVPVIVKRIKYTAPGGGIAYRLPEAGDPYVYYPAQDWAFQAITTQSSRKR